MGADHRYGFARRQGQRPVVFQQNQAARRDLTAQGPLLRIGHGGSYRRFVHIRMFKQAVLELDGEYPAHGFVQQRFVHTAGPHRIRKLGKRGAYRDLGTQAGLEGQFTGLLVGVRDVVEVPHLQHRRAVAGERPVKPHRVPQQGAGDAGIGPYRDAVDLAVVGHRGADMRLLVRRLKGGGRGLVHLPVPNAGGRAVQPPLGLRVAQKVLGDAGHAVGFVRLHALDIGHPPSG